MSSKFINSLNFAIQDSGRKARAKLHAGGKADKTGKFLLKKGEVVLNKAQQAKLKAAKTAAAAKKVVNTVAKKRPKKTGLSPLRY